MGLYLSVEQLESQFLVSTIFETHPKQRLSLFPSPHHPIRHQGNIRAKTWAGFCLQDLPIAPTVSLFLNSPSSTPLMPRSFHPFHRLPSFFPSLASSDTSRTCILVSILLLVSIVASRWLLHSFSSGSSSFSFVPSNFPFFLL